MMLKIPRCGARLDFRCYGMGAMGFLRVAASSNNLFELTFPFTHLVISSIR